jgi:uncharacterized membrane protein HdeD (DUF308 family)
VKASPIERFVIGVILTLAGLAVIIFHRSIKEREDRRNSRPFPFGYGEMWTGTYTRGGLIFTYAAIILVGVGLLYLGIANLVSAFRN